MIDLKKATVRWNWDHYTPKKIYGVLSKRVVGTPRHAASLFLKQSLKQLKITADQANLRYEKTVESLGGFAVFSPSGWPARRVMRLVCF
jgi:hypothetical protein